MPLTDDSADLISLARAKQAVNQTAWTAPDEALLAVAISAASNSARRWCRSPLALEALEEIHPLFEADQSAGIRLRAAPARLVLRLSTDPSVGLVCTCATGGWLKVGTSQIECQVGVGPVRALTLASHATLAGLAAALVALEPALNISVVEAAAKPLDLACTGARLPLGVNPLVLEVYRQQQFAWRFWPTLGELRFTGPWVSQVALRAVVLVGHLPLPPAVEEAVAQWSSTLYWRMRGQTTGLPGDGAQPPEGVRALLAPWRVYPLGEAGTQPRSYPP